MIMDGAMEGNEMEFDKMCLMPRVGVRVPRCILDVSVGNMKGVGDSAVERYGEVDEIRMDGM